MNHSFLEPGPDLGLIEFSSLRAAAEEEEGRFMFEQHN